MKNVYRLALALALGFSVAACNKNSDNGSQIAVAPDSLQCNDFTQTAYGGQYGNQYGNQAYGSPYGGYNNYQSAYSNLPYNPYQWNQGYNVNNGFCGCSQGEVPACSPGGGMYCVPQVQSANGYAQYNYRNGAYGYGGINQFSNGSCQTGVGQICQVGVVGSCGGYGQCVQTNVGSPYGICATTSY